MISWSPKHSTPISDSVVLQGLGLLLGSTVLDGGGVFATVVFTIIGYWVGVLLILIRRGKNPTNMDIFFERWGVPVLWFAVTIPTCFIRGGIG